MKKRITSLTLAAALIASSYGVSASPYAAPAGNAKTSGTPANVSVQLPREYNDQAAAPNMQLIKLAKKPWQKKWKPGPGPKPHHHHHRGRYKGVEIGIGIAILGLLAAGAAKSNGYQNAIRRCERDYRSFDPESGTYVTFGGDVRLCPYLEPYVD